MSDDNFLFKTTRSLFFKLSWPIVLVSEKNDSEKHIHVYSTHIVYYMYYIIRYAL